MTTTSPSALAAFLAAGARAADDDIKAVLKRGALNVKRTAAANAAASSGDAAPAYPRSISFDDVQGSAGFGAGSFSVEIGPDKGRRQGALGNLLEYGSANNGPHDDLKRAVDAEEPNLERYLLAAMARRW